eukprot:TRINITY_DN12885_c0_g1_i1.p1 TRINITY_DN12885_c0_g1~~TRINITY_DN12885_c0_g1_i1.p1  ORF type:complete len:260 (+),score=16.05 TRINITY_DN12885_c0_g1_i1:41-781(+)
MHARMARRHRRLTTVGNPGCGTTSMFRQIASEIGVSSRPSDTESATESVTPWQKPILRFATRVPGSDPVFLCEDWSPSGSVTEADTDKVRRLHDSDLVSLVFDRTSPEPLSDSVDPWLRVVEQVTNSPVLLVGAKADLPSRPGVESEVAEWLGRHPGVRYFEVSTVTNTVVIRNPASRRVLRYLCLCCVARATVREQDGEEAPDRRTTPLPHVPSPVLEGVCHFYAPPAPVLSFMEALQFVALTCL